VLARAIGHDVKGKVSPVLYVAGILLAFIDARIAMRGLPVGGADVAHPRPADRKGGRALLIARALRALTIATARWGNCLAQRSRRVCRRECHRRESAR